MRSFPGPGPGPGRAGSGAPGVGMPARAPAPLCCSVPLNCAVSELGPATQRGCFLPLGPHYGSEPGGVGADGSGPGWVGHAAVQTLQDVPHRARRPGSAAAGSASFSGWGGGQVLLWSKVWSSFPSMNGRIFRCLRGRAGQVSPGWKFTLPTLEALEKHPLCSKLQRL